MRTARHLASEDPAAGGCYPISQASFQVCVLLLDEPTEAIPPNFAEPIDHIVSRCSEAFRITIVDKGETVAAGKLNEQTDAMVRRHIDV